MTNSATSTDRAANDRPAFHVWHFFVLLSLLGATVAVMVSSDTHPVALLLLSAAVIGAGLVGIALSGAISGFFHRQVEALPVPAQARDRLLREKAFVLRSIKELEFDRAMGKVSETDFEAISSRLRARAIALIQDLDRIQAPPPAPAASAPMPARSVAVCAQCGTSNDVDARFCKQCGHALQATAAVPS